MPFTNMPPIAQTYIHVAYACQVGEDEVQYRFKMATIINITLKLYRQHI